MITRRPLAPGTKRRQTVPRLGHGGCAGSSAVIVAPASVTRAVRAPRSAGVTLPAVSPVGGRWVGSGRTSRARKARSRSGDWTAPRRPTWNSTGWRAGTCSVTADVGSSVASEPPAPTPSQAFGSLISDWTCAACAVPPLRERAAGTSLWTNAARSTTASVCPVASSVTSVAVGCSGIRYQTVRANDFGPRQRGTPASGVASASSAVACRSVGTPFSAV